MSRGAMPKDVLGPRDPGWQSCKPMGLPKSAPERAVIPLFLKLPSTRGKECG